MVEILIQIESGIRINVNVRAKIQKHIMCAKNITSRILLHVPVKIGNIQKVLLVIH